jgi:hypothetical protein
MIFKASVLTTMNRLLKGFGFQTLVLIAGLFVTVAGAVQAIGADPAWWSEGVKSGAPVSDFSIVNQGQAKWFATKAEEELMSRLPEPYNNGILGTLPEGDNYAPINQGQLKTLIKPLYDRIHDAAVAFPNNHILDCLPVGMTGNYPWTDATTDDQSYALVNIGQLKRALSFDFDRLPPTVSITASDPDAGEPSNPGEYTITRSGPKASALLVRFSVGGTAAAGTYTLGQSSPVTIPVGSASTTFTLNPANNSTYEGTRTTVLTLTDDSAYIVDQRTATVTITDDDPPPSISVVANDPDAGEPSNPGQFTITRTGSSASDLVVYLRMEGTAVNGDDYIAISSPVTITAPNLTKTITLTPQNDSVYEGTRIATLTLLDHDGYAVGTRSASVTITDDDPPSVSVMASDSDAAQGASPNTGQYIITRNGPVTGNLQVYFTVTGTAVSPTDYTLDHTSPTLIPDGVATATILLTPTQVDSQHPYTYIGTRNATLSLSDHSGYSVATRTATVAVMGYPSNDTDRDGLLDDWELQYFSTLNRDGSGDYDQDGLSDGFEFLESFSPVTKNVEFRWFTPNQN